MVERSKLLSRTHLRPNELELIVHLLVLGVYAPVEGGASTRRAGLQRSRGKPAHADHQVGRRCKWSLCVSLKVTVSMATLSR